jgi:hypothetical protein
MKPDEVVRRLNSAGLQTFLYYSVQKDEIYCKVTWEAYLGVLSKVCFRRFVHQWKHWKCMPIR